MPMSWTPGRPPVPRLLQYGFRFCGGVIHVELPTDGSVEHLQGVEFVVIPAADVDGDDQRVREVPVFEPFSCSAFRNGVMSSMKKPPRGGTPKRTLGGHFGQREREGWGEIPGASRPETTHAAVQDGDLSACSHPRRGRVAKARSRVQVVVSWLQEPERRYAQL